MLLADRGTGKESHAEERPMYSVASGVLLREHLLPVLVRCVISTGFEISGLVPVNYLVI